MFYENYINVYIKHDIYNFIIYRHKIYVYIFQPALDCYINIKVWCMKYVIQEHNADVAGKHYDFRIDMDSGAVSWAIRHWPKMRYEKRLAVKQPNHTVQYMSWSGTIPAGEYGAGTVKIKKHGNLDMIERRPDKLTFRMDNDKYVLFKTSGDKWLIEKL